MKKINSKAESCTLASGDLCCLLVAFANSLDTKCQSWSVFKLFDTLIEFLKDFLEKSDFENSQMTKKGMKNYPASKELIRDSIANSWHSGKPKPHRVWVTVSKDESLVTVLQGAVGYILANIVLIFCSFGRCKCSWIKNSVQIDQLATVCSERYMRKGAGNPLPDCGHTGCSAKASGLQWKIDRPKGAGKPLYSGEFSHTYWIQ